MPPLPVDLARTLDLCEYRAPFLTEKERKAILEFYVSVPNCLRHTELKELFIEAAPS
ncbi:hypothetical protein ACIRQP_14350 [Streptomyces sp. NPDC102274]|uniref:hypothetical protein n=1 Tax=Streptomyces sp. NPDC102274 TaxID=3366151 RepID=UPI00380B1CFE